MAFPDGIPYEIWASGYDHREPYPGDGGVIFERDRSRPMPAMFRNLS